MPKMTSRMTSTVTSIRAIPVLSGYRSRWFPEDVTMFRSVRAVWFLLFLLAFTQAGAQVSDDAAQDLLSKSGLADALSVIGPQFKASMSKMASQKGVTLSANDLDRIQLSIDSAYAPQHLQAQVRRV